MAIPILYLKGISTGDFQEALVARLVNRQLKDAHHRLDALTARFRHGSMDADLQELAKKRLLRLCRVLRGRTLPAQRARDARIV